MRLSLDQMADMFAARLYKDRAATGIHEIIFQGRVWKVRYDGRLNASILLDGKEEKHETVA